MDFEYLIVRLERSGVALHSLMSGLESREVAWKPDPAAWSILEICAHLLDEEKEDFRTRLLLTIEDPGKTWPPINPESWVSERAYEVWNFEETLQEFVFERTVSIGRLRDLDSPDWEKAYEHPRGVLRAGDLLAAWVAHDLLHMRQISHRLWQVVNEISRPFHSRYAGVW